MALAPEEWQGINREVLRMERCGLAFEEFGTRKFEGAIGRMQGWRKIQL
jgi:hypothetical protein